MNIGIVTSSYNYYDRFLIQWINSITSLTIKPNEVIIVISGKRYLKDNILKAENLLKESNIFYKILRIRKHKGMGFARNFAVKHVNTKYVMYLDIDDIIKPNAIEILNKYEGKADVICGGLEIVSKDGIVNEIYKPSNDLVLTGKRCYCSHAVFRKELWNKFKYPENGIKSELCNGFLWLGFAKNGASSVFSQGYSRF